VVEQAGPPLELYDRPGNLFVASFIGSPAMNLLKGSVVLDGGPAFHGGGGTRMPLATLSGIGNGQKAVLGIRPEHLSLSEEGFPVTIAVVEPSGPEIQVVARTQSGEEIVANFRERHPFKPGDTIRLSAAPDLIHLFHGETGNRLAS
jgi:multiple sugar transport system ATP-binding protein